jgi:5-formyltetrahydrofolate cyclo-ligase
MLKEEKSKLRKEILKIRDELPSQTRNLADLVIADRIIGHQWFYRSEVVLGFVNYGSEISTEEILKEALKKNKILFLPKIVGEDMLFYRIYSLEDLESGYKGIREPKGDTECFSYNNYKDSRLLILVPGVAFDIYGNRMGYGKGFYDKFLADKEVLQTYSIGIGYKCQQVENLPFDALDIKPYQVILV